MNRTLYLVSVLLVGSQSLAGSGWVTKVKNHLEKTKKCEVALYEVFKKKEQRESSLQQMVTDVTCITDLTFSKGTIHEANGCSLSWYNVESNNYRNFAQTGPTMVKGLSCAKGGFEILLKMDLWSGMSVGKYISSESDTAKPIIIYSVSHKYKEALAKAIKVSKAERENYKAEQAKENLARQAKSKAFQKRVNEKEVENQKKAKKVEGLYE